jgi:anti-sigma factor RsiW
MTIDCSNFEILAVDFLDGALDPAARAAFDAHRDACPACAAALIEHRELLDLVERCADVEPPPQLITRIVHETPDRAGRRFSKQPGSLLDLALGWFRPILQPRFAMGMAMTILSFSMLGKFAAPVKQLKPADLDPVKVWAQVEDRAHRTWERGVKYYESLRLVWEIRAQLRELNNAEPAESGPHPDAKKKADANDRPANTR